MEEAVEPLSHLLVRKIFAALQGCLAQLDRFNKTGFLGQIPADRLLGQRIRIAASMGGEFRKLVLLLGCEMYFH